MHTYIHTSLQTHRNTIKEYNDTTIEEYQAGYHDGISNCNTEDDFNSNQVILL